MVHSADTLLATRGAVKQRIQDAALACFCENGLGGATMASIAARAGLSTAGLYLYFENKRALFDSLDRPDLDQPAARVRVRRERILEAALSVFSQRGYEAASMDEIAEAVGLSKAALYGHFANKVALFLEVLHHARAGEDAACICAPLGADEHGAACDPERVPALLRQVARSFLRQHQDPQRFELLRIVVAEGVRNPEVATMVLHMIDDGAAEIARHLQALGFGKKRVLAQLAKAFLGMLFSWLLLNRVLACADPTTKTSLARDVRNEEAAAERAVSLFLDGARSVIEREGKNTRREALPPARRRKRA